jgi:hypothetical protein
MCIKLRKNSELCNRGFLFLYSRKRENLLVEWQKGSGTKRSKMNWHLLPSTWRGSTWHRGFELPRSIVLHELITNEFGHRTRRNILLIIEIIP